MINNALPPESCDGVIRAISRIGLNAAGSRNVLVHDWCGELACALKVHVTLAPLLPPDPVAVQCTLFEKSAAKNWGVGIHQDLSIPVRERVDAPDCGGWSHKEGVLYTQAPRNVLESLVVVRVHLDPCSPTAGPLRVVPGSHVWGRLSDAGAEQQRAQRGEVECVADRGAALVMRPLLLHSSSRVTGAAVRRVLHFLFGPRCLPYGLRWHQAV